MWITYELAPGVPALDHPASGTTVATSTPMLAVKALSSPNAGRTVSYWFRGTQAADAESGAQSVDSGWISSAQTPVAGCPSGDVCWLPTPGRLADGVTYYWHAYATDDGADWIFPSWVASVRVDLHTGAGDTMPADQVGPVSVNLASGNVAFDHTGPSTNTVGGPLGVSLSYDSAVASSFEANGLTAEYFADSSGSFTGSPVFVRRDPSPGFRWYGTSPGQGIAAGNFSARWTGTITLPASLPANSSLQFYAAHTGGMRVIFNGAIVLNKWSDTGYVEPDLIPAATYNPGQKITVEIDYKVTGGSALAGLAVIGPFGPNNSQLNIAIQPSWLTPSEIPALPAGWNMAVAGARYTSAFVSEGYVSLTDVTGGHHVYPWNGKGYEPPPGEDGVLAFDANNRVTLQDTDGVTYGFDSHGRLAWASSPTDDYGPASATFQWTTTWTTQITAPPPRLTAVVDAATGRTITLSYGGDASCPTSPPVNLAVAPLGMLCQVAYLDSTKTTAWYNANNQLAEIADVGDATPAPPAFNVDGPERTDFSYTGAPALLQAVRTPLANDAISSGVQGAPNPSPAQDPTVTLITYANGQAQSIGLPVPTPDPTGTLPIPSNRPGHSYVYVPGADDFHAESRVRVGGGDETVHPWARDVAFAQDPLKRTVTVVDADGTGQATSPVTRATTTAFDSNGTRPLSVTDSAGRMTTTIYDTVAARAHPTWLAGDVYGPALASCFNMSTGLPNASCTPPPAHTATVYDGAGASPWLGLDATYFRNTSLSVFPDSPPAPPTPWPVQIAHGSEVSPDANGGFVAADPPNTSFTARQWSARYTGEIALGAGTYTFALSYGGHARLFVDDQLVVDGWTGTGTSASGPYVSTLAGRHRIRVEYKTDGAVALLQLRWTPPGGSQAAVPASVLFPRYGDATQTTVYDTDGAPNRVSTTAFDTPTDAAHHADALPMAQTQDPSGLNVKSSAAYAIPAVGAPAGSLLRLSSSTQPSGAAGTTTYGYSDPSAAATNPCPVGGSAPQGGLLSSTTSPDPGGGSRVSSVIYDSGGRVVASKASASDARWTCTTRDARFRVTNVTYPDLRSVTYNYALNNNPLVNTITDSVGGTITTTLDMLGRIVSYTDSFGDRTDYTYDQPGFLITQTVTPPGQSQPQGRLDFRYDAGGRVLEQFVGDAGAKGPSFAQAAYDSSSGELASATYANGSGLAVGRNPPATRPPPSSDSPGQARGKRPSPTTR